MKNGLGIKTIIVYASLFLGACVYSTAITKNIQEDVHQDIEEINPPYYKQSPYRVSFNPISFGNIKKDKTT